MRTKLAYSVQREPDENGKEHIKNRGYTLTVLDAKTEKEHEAVVTSFESFLKSRNIHKASAYGHGSWEECVRLNDTENFLFLDIPVVDTEDKQYIKELYQEWKERMSW